MVVHEVLAVVESYDTPVRAVVNIVRLPAVLKGYVQRPVHGDVVAAH